MGTQPAFDAMAVAFAHIAADTFPRSCVFQRLPTQDEDQIDDRGFPIAEYTDIDPDNPIPCIFIVQGGREVLIQNQQRSVTPYKVTVPALYISIDSLGMENLQPIPWGAGNRIKILADETNQELILQIYSGGDDPGPDFTFTGFLTDTAV